MLPHYYTQDKDIVNMDTQERLRCQSESSMSGTSGYSTTASPGHSNSPGSSNNNYSPAPSPVSASLQAEFLNLQLPAAQQTTLQGFFPLQETQQQSQYIQLQPLHEFNNNAADLLNTSYNYTTVITTTAAAAPPPAPQMNFQQVNSSASTFMQANSTAYTAIGMLPRMYGVAGGGGGVPIKSEYPAKLSISEQPVEKFRFRYKSEMHGTHGSLNGANSQRNTKSYPEVELQGYTGPAVICCSLFQTNLESPHSHQLVVRKDDHDMCDPHELKVSSELGYFAEFKNMGIIHTAKKFICDELLKKKTRRLLFELGRDELTSKEEQELRKQTEKEAKDMNLNQVRLCFEAFRIESNNQYTPIAAPIYSNPINNRKSAQTGELRITRLSISSGSVAGNEDLILLVEKVSKKNIKVRFFEMNEDEELVWEAFATFRESDVHHQYAIVCRTPPYKDKNIDKSVDVLVELVRPSDDERSYPTVSFRYKPREAVISRKRRRTCSTARSSSSSSGSLSSGDIPKTVAEQEQQQQQKPASGLNLNYSDIASEIERLLNNTKSSEKISGFFDSLSCTFDFLEPPPANESASNNDASANDVTMGRNEKDGVCSSESSATEKTLQHYKKLMISKKRMDLLNAAGAAGAEQQTQQKSTAAGSYQHTALPSTNSASTMYIKRIHKISTDVRLDGKINNTKLICAGEQIEKIFYEHYNKTGESLLHDLVENDNVKLAIELCKILEYFKLNRIFNSILNAQQQTALHCACLYDRSHYIRPILALGCNPNLSDAKGDTALHIAVRERHLQCVESLINSNVRLQLSILNDDGFTAVHLAIRETNLEIASLLLRSDRSIGAVANGKDGNNALHMIVQQQNTELLKLILDSQNMENILNMKNTAGHLPLELAQKTMSSSKQAGEIFRLLLAYYQQHGIQYSSSAASSHRSQPSSLSSSSSTLSSLSSVASSTASGGVDNTVGAAAATICKGAVAIEENSLDFQSYEVIKEEDISSNSSTEEDDDDDDNYELTIDEQMETTSTPPTSLESSSSSSVFPTATECYIKQENIIDMHPLKSALDNKHIFQKLVDVLSPNEKWRDLAKELNLECYFAKNAGGMLSSLKRNLDNIDYAKFSGSIKKIDENLWNLIKNCK